MTGTKPRKKAVKRLVPKGQKAEVVKPKKIKQIAKVKPAPAPAPVVKKERRTRTRKIAWMEVARQFINGILPENPNVDDVRRWPTLAEVARAFNISETMIYMRAREGEWSEKRDAFQRELRTQEDARLIQELADRRVRSQVAFAATGQQIQAQVARKLRQGDLDEKGLQRLAGSLRGAQQVVEVAMGKPADGEGSGVTVDWTQFITLAPAPARIILAQDDLEGPEIGGVVTPQRGS